MSQIQNNQGGAQVPPQRRAVRNFEALRNENNNFSRNGANPPQRRRYKRKMSFIKFLFRAAVAICVSLLLAFFVAYSAVHTIATGPSQTLRDQLVLMAMQASATKWVPGLFLSDEVVEQIVLDSKTVNTETDSLDEYISSSSDEVAVDMWDKAIDGMI
ncbi:MAG: hypothetical protein IKT44_03480, partial [Clostridia bacterium]|nr:hypothetical protein [Clostridia bacterium]